MNGLDRGRIIVPNTPSPLRYPGGKTKLYQFVRNIIQANNLLHETYIEPFAGGAGLAIKLLQSGDVRRIVINDYDPAIYAFWSSVLHRAGDFCEFIMNVPLTIDEWDFQKEIYENSDRYNEFELAKAVLFLNRSNISGVITGGVIGGREQTGSFRMDARFNREAICKKILDIASLSGHIDLYQLDAMEFLGHDILGHYYKTFINFDPPYVEKGGQLYKNSFTQEDHRRLRDCIANCRRKWIVTYDSCDYVAELYHRYRKSILNIYYSANSVRKATEYVFFSNNLLLPGGVDLI